MKFGVNTFIWSASVDRSTLDLLPRIKERGFDGVELPMFGAANFPAAEVRRAVDESDLECTICSVLGNGLSVISEDATVRRTTRTHLEACIQAAAAAGATLIAGPLYSPVGYLPGRRRTPTEWSAAVECYQALGPTLAQHGVQLAIEPLNRFETYFLNTAADAFTLCDEIDHPSVGILFDTFHANIEEKDVAAACLSVGRHLKHMHTCENDRGTPGSGHIDWRGVFDALRTLQYDGWLTIESFGFSISELSAAAAIWRDLAITPEAIAFDGVQFLKQSAAAIAAA
ncbi:MAG: TIM barrel protein [Luteitalea sp.]|nr:TIM barrel protein [Luteitalea sp.]